MNKKWVVIGLLVISGLFVLLAPPQYKDKIIGLATFYTDERKCFNHHKETLKDPSSAYLVSSFIHTKELEKSIRPNNMDPAFDKYDEILYVKIQAKNVFGAYGSMYVECPLVNGKFSDHEAFMHRMK